MNLLARIDGALGYLFVRCSGFGLLDDASTRRYKAGIFVALWLMTMAFSFVSAFSFWFYSLHDVYDLLWPFQAYGNRIAGAGVLVILGGPAFLVAFSVGRRYARYARPKAKLNQGFALAIFYLLVIAMFGASKFKYGSLIAVTLNVAFSAWLLRESGKEPLVMS